MVYGKRRAVALLLGVCVGLGSMEAARGEISALPRPTPVVSPSLVIPAGVVLPRRIGADAAKELHCLAQNIYFEARSESTAGQVGVAMVTLNRVAARAFPSTVCGVVRQGGYRRSKRCQFSWYCDGKSDVPRDAVAWRRAKLIAYQAVFHGLKDPTRGALWYHADYVKPRWARKLRRTIRIGKHLYYGKT